MFELLKNQFLSNRNDGQYHEEYLVYSKSNSVEINEEARNSLEKTLTTSAT